METTAFYMSTTFWVGVSFFLFVGLVLYSKAHNKIAAMLDERSSAIAKQIVEAEALRDEAEKMLAEYQRKQREAEQEAADIIKAAKDAAEALKADAAKDIEKMIERRSRMATEKIAQEEAAAVKEVKEAAVDIAITATEKVLTESLKGPAGKSLIERSINDINVKLN